MNDNTADKIEEESLLGEVIDYLGADPLCMEIRHYPANDELTENDKLHLLVIMERELNQSERREHLERLQALAAPYGRKIDVLFSSPKVWRDLGRLVSPFTRIEREATVCWQRRET